MRLRLVERGLSPTSISEDSTLEKGKSIRGHAVQLHQVVWVIRARESKLERVGKRRLGRIGGGAQGAHEL